MSKKKGILTGALLLIGAGAIGGGAWWYFHTTSVASNDVVVYVSSVAEINAANPDLTTMCYGGIVEAQKTNEVTVDLSKTVAEIYVKDGDVVKKGTPLFQYDIDEMQLELESGTIEIEQMQNEIASYEEQIRQLEAEKLKADADQQLSYTTQIQSLQTSISKTEYEIKVKDVSQKKLKKAIDHATVEAEHDGTIGAIKSVETLRSEGGDVLMTITENGSCRIKGTISEQQLGQLTPQQRVVIRSRTDAAQCWMGTITDFGTEAETSRTDFYMSDSEASASKYPFYITLDDAKGLLIGQHVLIEPDMGQTEGKTGVWIYEDYLVQDETSSYVWAADRDGMLKKQTVTLGETDATYGIVEILSGLTELQRIAYPDPDFQEGMRTTTNASKASSDASEDSEDGAFAPDPAFEEAVPADAE